MQQDSSTTTMTKFLLTIAALTGAASAFTPSATVKSSSSLNASADGMVSGKGPEFLPFSSQSSSGIWDPYGFAERAPEWQPWLREAELKNGRAAMLACAGMVVPEVVRVPGEAYSFASIPNVLDAHDALPQSMIQIFAWISFLEACSFPAYANMNNYDRAPGDFGFDPLGLYPKDPKKQKDYQISELKNGRLAMISIGGMVAGATITGHGFPYLP